jgi:hypothetical protein
MIAATPLLATKEPADDTAVEDDSAVVAEAGEEAVTAPLVEALEDPLAPTAPLAADAADAPVTLGAAADPVTELLAPLATEVNGMTLPVAVPVALRLRGPHAAACTA